MEVQYEHKIPTLRAHKRSSDENPSPHCQVLWQRREYQDSSRCCPWILSKGVFCLSCDLPASRRVMNTETSQTSTCCSREETIPPNGLMTRLWVCYSSPFSFLATVEVSLFLLQISGYSVRGCLCYFNVSVILLVSFYHEHFYTINLPGLAVVPSSTLCFSGCLLNHRLISTAEWQVQLAHPRARQLAGGTVQMWHHCFSTAAQVE